MDWMALHTEVEKVNASLLSKQTESTSAQLVCQRPRRLVLAMWKDSYLRRADTLQSGLEKAYGKAGVERWTADLVSRTSLSQKLATHRIPLAVYLGHGRERGWSGYRGLRLHHLRPPAEPVGLLVSLSCETLAFGQQLLEEGYVQAFLGSKYALAIPGLTRLVGGLARVFSMEEKPPITAAELMSKLDEYVSASSSVELKEVWSQLQLIGNPSTSI